MLSLTTLFTTILLGSMLFFVAIVAPSIFKSLDAEEALKFTKNVFPKYYLWGIVVSALATVSAIIAGSYTAILLFVVLLGFAYSRQILAPKIRTAKDQWLASDSPQDKALYKSLHKQSVIINATQTFILLIIVIVTQVFHLN